MSAFEAESAARQGTCEPQSGPASAGWQELRRRYRRSRRAMVLAVACCGAICALIGTMVLLAWAFGLPRVRSVLPGAVEMKANTALALLLAGGALVSFALGRQATQVRRGSRWAQAMGSAVAVIGALTLAEYALRVDLGIDQLLVRDDTPEPFAPFSGRMSPFSAAAFAAIGVALITMHAQRWRWVAQACASATLLIGSIAVLGYLWSAPELFTDMWAPPVAVHTGMAFVLLGAGALLAAHLLRPRPVALRFLFDPIERKVAAGFAGALLLLLIVGGFTYRAADEDARYAGGLVQREVTRGQLNRHYADMADAVFLQRAYLFAPDRGAAQRWRDALRQLQGSSAALRRASGALEPAERADLGALDAAVRRLIDVLQQGAAILETQGEPAARLFERGGAGSSAMASVREAVARIDASHHADDQARANILREKRWRILVVFLSILLGAAAVLIAVFAAIRRETQVRLQAERSLRRRSAEASAASRFLESFVENLPQMVMVKDAQLRLVRFNRAAEQLTGLDRSHVLGRRGHDLFPVEQADSFGHTDRQVLAGRKMIDIPEEAIQTPRGLRLLHTRKIPLLDPRGWPTHVVGMSEDVTQAREAERQIRALNEALSARADEVERVTRAKSDFLATMSHEIRTPLNAMLGLLELLSLNTLSAQQQRTLIVVAEAGQSLLRIIDDVLDFSKIEADKLDLRYEAASVARIVGDVCSVHEGIAGAKGLVLAKVVDRSLRPALYVDSVRLRQILNNFVSNAVKFTMQGKVEIRVEVLATDDRTQELRFAVEDTGPGLSRAEQERLFQPFVQVGPVGSRTEGGTGLGLVISRRLAQLMGGTVAMASTPGQGTTMELRLKLEVAPAELLPPDLEQQIARWRQTLTTIRPAPTVAEAAAEGTLVLVVDDHPSNRMLLQQQLATLGYASESAEDGAQALRQWQTGRFGLVLTDCQMAGIDGYELAARIRREEVARKLPRTPILACTAMALEGEAQRCADAGMDGVLVKPLQLQEVFDAVRRWLPVARGTPAQPGAGSASGQAAPVVDTAAIQAMWGVDAASVGPIFAAYRRSAADDRAALRAAVDRRDREEVIRSAHRMLGASKMVGAHAMAEVCQVLLAEASAGKWDPVLKALEAFEGEYACIVDGGAP